MRRITNNNLTDTYNQLYKQHCKKYQTPVRVEIACDKDADIKLFCRWFAQNQYLNYYDPDNLHKLHKLQEICTCLFYLDCLEDMKFVGEWDSDEPVEQSHYASFVVKHHSDLS